MANLTTSIDNGFAQISTIIKQVRDNLLGKIGDITSLKTVAKSSLVDAVNETKANADSKAKIDDGNTNSTATWSSNKINASISKAITDVIGGADTANDTLKEIGDRVTALAQADAGLISATQAQNFSEVQKSQARSNIDVYSKTEIGDVTTDFVATVNNTYNAS